jgi:excisionase family DNA binding protein
MSALALAPSAASTWLLYGQAARRLGCSRTVVRRLVDEGRLTVRRVGCWARVPAHEVDALAESCTTPAVAG